MPADGAILALDVGTSSCRAALYDRTASHIERRAAHASYTPRLTTDGGATLDPLTLLNDLSGAIDQVLAEPGPPIVGVGCATFWHSLVGVDATGRPLTPLYLWLDSRARSELPSLRSRLDERAVHARTGCVLHWTYWPAKLTWIRRSQPDVFKEVRRWISFGEFVREQWTGERGVSVSMASATGLLNIHTCEWDAQVLDAVGITPDALGPIVRLDTRVATTDRWPALKCTPWFPAAGDGACSNVGAGCTTPERFALMVGTSGAERVVWSADSVLEIPRGAWCYRVDEQRTVMGGALNDGGSLLTWLRESLRLPDLESMEAEVAAMTPDSHGLTVLPYWGGERNPHWADDARGALVGMRLSTRPIDVYRACLEAVALRFAEMDHILLQALPDAREVIATGGALLHSPAWMQILADVLGRPVFASTEAEASSRGAALLALESLHLLDKPLDHLLPGVSRRVDSIAAHTERYRAALQRQRRLYDALVT